METSSTWIWKESTCNIDTKIDVLNTYFQIRDDSVHISSGQLLFTDVHVYDREGNSGVVNGYLHHTKLKNLMYHFKYQWRQSADV